MVDKQPPYRNPEGHIFARYERDRRDSDPDEYYRDYYPPDHPDGVRDPSLPSKGEKWVPYAEHHLNGRHPLDTIEIVKVVGDMIYYWLADPSVRGTKGWGTSIDNFLTMFHPRKKYRRGGEGHWQATWLKEQYDKGNTDVGPWIWDDPEHLKHMKYSLKPKDCKKCNPGIR